MHSHKEFVLQLLPHLHLTKQQLMNVYGPDKNTLVHLVCKHSQIGLDVLWKILSLLQERLQVESSPIQQPDTSRLTEEGSTEEGARIGEWWYGMLK